jgi:hypothetical protein
MERDDTTIGAVSLHRLAMGSLTSASAVRKTRGNSCVLGSVSPGRRADSIVSLAFCLNIPPAVRSLAMIPVEC